MDMFKPVSQVGNFAEIEERLIAYWKDNKTFEKSILTRSPQKKWTFLDGPPFITGLPHYGTLLASIPKDMFPRYWTMKGYQVRRVWGWDVHGLPAENKVENKLGLKRKKDIEEKIGVKKFIEECKKYVSESSKEWEWYVDHIARWVDFEHAYKTMDTTYMETVMWVFHEMYTKGFVYKGLRVSLYCPHCATPISNFEVAMDPDNYQDKEDLAATYKYKLKGEDETYILAWSTTPWNKLVTPALAVNPDLVYVKVRQNKQDYILAKNTLNMLDGNYKVVSEMKGLDLVGKEFELHYDFYKPENGKKRGVIIPGDFVTADEGTGVVTIAAYGEEDMKAMQEHNIQVVMHLDDEGAIKSDVPVFGGMFYLDANKAVNEDLDARGLLYKETPMIHSVPTCWRCHTRLYYAPQNAWYVDVQSLKPAMKKTNEAVHWFPKHFKYGRFLKSMEHAPDWNISRSRYWGSPVPVWECACGERFVPGSIADLEKASGQKIQELHKPEIDEVTVTCLACGKKVHRVPEVLDSWIEAGSASFAERHFPFANAQGKPADKLEDFYPPDFIVEYTGQIRAWFYVLHVIGAALFDSPAFKNVVTTGTILGTDGRKMSKNYGNYPDPKELLQKYGGDALRLYLLGTPVMHGEDILISEEQYRNQVRGFLLILWNVYNYFVTYANENKWEHTKDAPFSSKNVLDKWIVSRLNTVNKEISAAIEGYDTVAVVSVAQSFVTELSTWYIRRSRDRVSFVSEDTADREAFFETTHHVLTAASQILAPLTPFITEEIYRNLTNAESVHLTYWPDIEEDKIDVKLEEEMVIARKIVEQTHSLRKEAGIKLRQPLGSITVTVPTGLSAEVAKVIADEVNVKTVTVDPGEALTVKLNTDITPELQAEGEARDIARSIQEERKKLGTTLREKVAVTLPSWPKEYEEYIMKKALVSKIEKGATFAVVKA